MKLNKNFLPHTRGSEAFIIPSGKAKFSGLVSGNETLGEIVKLLQHDTTKIKIVAAMQEKYNAPDGIIERDVEKVITTLQSIGALDE